MNNIKMSLNEKDNIQESKFAKIEGKNFYIKDDGVNYFHNRCEKWLSFLGMMNWTILFESISDENENFRASAYRNAESRCATITLNRVYGNMGMGVEIIPWFLNRDAFHEVIHILLGDLQEIAYDRFATEKRWEIAEESLVRIFEHSFYNEIIDRDEWVKDEVERIKKEDQKIKSKK